MVAMLVIMMALVMIGGHDGFMMVMVMITMVVIMIMVIWKTKRPPLDP